jgi:hypothetical protein
MPTEEQIEKALILGKRPGKPILDQWRGRLVGLTVVFNLFFKG